MRRLSLLLPALLLSSACAHHHVVRDSSTFAIEVASSLARQTEAAEALRNGAELALAGGDRELCAELAEPALLIEAAAEVQAHRALWLAALPYPVVADDGSLTVPDVGTEQPDPGPAPDPDPVDTICGPVAPTLEEEPSDAQ